VKRSGKTPARAPDPVARASRACGMAGGRCDSRFLPDFPQGSRLCGQAFCPCQSRLVFIEGQKKFCSGVQGVATWSTSNVRCPFPIVCLALNRSAELSYVPQSTARFSTRPGGKIQLQLAQHPFRLGIKNPAFGLWKIGKPGAGWVGKTKCHQRGNAQWLIKPYDQSIGFVQSCRR